MVPEAVDELTVTTAKPWNHEIEEAIAVAVGQYHAKLELPAQVPGIDMRTVVAELNQLFHPLMVHVTHEVRINPLHPGPLPRAIAEDVLVFEWRAP